MKLISNRELSNLDDGKDLIGLKDKANVIRIFIEEIINNQNKVQMLALYGNWGSGKTSVMKDVMKNIDQKVYKPILFEAWRYEKDENIASSLYSAIANELDSKFDKVVKEVGKTSGSFFKALAKSASFNLGILSIDGDNLISSVEDDEVSEETKKSFFELEEEFKQSFLNLEKQITKDQKIIVFIDDLDRCEPEKVIDLLSAIKLFFTYGENIIFMCGLDLFAVKQAIKTKYGDIIKSEEYLEKIFDHSFFLSPNQKSILPLIHEYFRNCVIKPPNEEEQKKGVILLSNIVNELFEKLEYTNPRHIKKVLNKYAVLCHLKENYDPNKGEYKNLILPNIITEKQTGNLFDTLVILFVLVLYENYNHLLYEIKNYDEKLIKHTEIMQKENAQTNPHKFQYWYNTVVAMVGSKGYFYKKSSQIVIDYTNLNNQRANSFNSSRTEIMTIFLPFQKIEQIGYANEQIKRYIKQFAIGDYNVLTNFCEFLFSNEALILSKDTNRHSELTIQELFEVPKQIL